MTHGIDTDFLVAAEITGHPNHQAADVLLSKLLDEGHDFALAPQTLAEFVHIVTDPRRMPDL
jgi:predicted nucleic acid-binding protein